MTTKTKWIAIILGIIILAIQQWRIGNLTDILDAPQKVDTLVIQGTIDTIQVVDTVTKTIQKVVHKVDTVKKEDVVIIYDTTIVYKPSNNFAFDIRFADSTKSPLVSVWGVAHYPSGLVDLAIKSKIDLKLLENKMRFYSGLGYGNKVGLFTTVSVSRASYQAQALLYKSGMGFSLSKKF